MFRSRVRKIFRDLWGRKGRTTLAATSIFIGVLGVVMLISMGDLYISQLQEDIKEEDLAMLEVSVTVPGEMEVDNAAVIDTLEALPGVTNVEGRAFYPLFWKLPGDDKLEEGIILAAWEPFGEMHIEPMRLLEGRFPVAGRQEVAIERRMADAQGLAVGDQLVLAVLSGGAPQEETWTVVGTVFQPYLPVTGPPGADPGEVSVFATYADAQYIADFGILSGLYVRFVDFNTAEQQVDNFVASLAQETPYVSLLPFLENPAENSDIQSAETDAAIFASLGILAMIVSGFLVTNVINAVVVEQRQQIGVMKSLGATRLDNVLIYIGIALSYGVIGLVPGVLLGAYLGFGAASWLASGAGTLIEGFKFSASGVGLGVVMGLLVPLLAALLPVFLGTRVTILQAMTDLGITVDYGRGLLARLIRVLPLPINVKQALSNITRKKGRLLLTWLTLTMAIGVFMAVFGTFANLGQMVDDIFGTFGMEIMVGTSDDQDIEQVEAILTQEVDGVNLVTPGTGMMIEVEGFEETWTGQSFLQVLGYDPQTDAFRLNLEAGTAWQTDPGRRGIVVTSGVAQQLEKGVGDRFVFTMGGRTFEEELIGIANVPILSLGFMNWQALAEMSAFVTGSTSPGVLYVQMDAADRSADDVDVLIDQAKERLLTEGITASYTNWVASAETTSAQIEQIGLIFTAAALVTAAVGAVGLLATLSMAVFERQKEIGVMRSIGAGSATIAGQFLVEGNLIGLLAWLVGIPLAFVVSAMLASVFPFEMDATVPPNTLLIGLVGTIVIATIASLSPSISAARKTVSQIIRYQ